jgi:hypothetical protein
MAIQHVTENEVERSTGITRRLSWHSFRTAKATAVFRLLIHLLVVTGVAHSEPAPLKLAVISAPGAWHIRTAEPGKQPSEVYPAVLNRVSECLPGALYDLRTLFEEYGAKFGANSFALYNPEAQVMLVRGAPEEVDSICTFVSGGTYCPTACMRIAFELVAKPGSGAEVRGTGRARWEMLTKGGIPYTATLSGGDALSYSCEFEPLLEPFGRSIDYRMLLKVKFEGREYSTTAEASAPMEKPHSILVGTTPAGEEITLTFTPTLIPPPITPPWSDEKLESVKKCVEKEWPVK